MAMFSNPRNLSGCFRHRETRHQFEFRITNNEWALNQGLTHEVAVAGEGLAGDYGYRFARVLKTIAHIAVDEGENGLAIMESWPIKLEWGSV